MTKIFSRVNNCFTPVCFTLANVNAATPHSTSLSTRLEHFSHATALTQSNGIRSRPVPSAITSYFEFHGSEGEGGSHSSRGRTEKQSSGHLTLIVPPQIFHLSTSKYYSVVAQSIIYPVWIFGWWLVPLNHRKTSRMRVETMMRAHQTGGEMVCCLAGREFISRKKKFNLYFGGPVFSHLT